MNTNAFSPVLDALANTMGCATLTVYFTQENVVSCVVVRSSKVVQVTLTATSEQFQSAIEQIGELAPVTTFSIPPYEVVEYKFSCAHNTGEQSQSGSMICTVCGKNLGWWCPQSPTNECEYDDGDWMRDSCIHCGQPEERK